MAAAGRERAKPPFPPCDNVDEPAPQRTGAASTLLIDNHLAVSDRIRTTNSEERTIKKA